MTLFLQQLLNGLALGSTYAIFAFGFGLIFATLGILNVAHGMFASWGALVALWCVESYDIPFVGALAVGVIAAGVIGIVVDRLAFQPLRKRDVGLLGTIITSIGVAIVLGTLVDEFTSHRSRRFPVGTFSEELVRFGDLGLQFIQIVNIVVAVVLAVLLHLLMRRTQTGASIRAVGWSPRAATISGVNAGRIILLTAFLAAALAGLAGVLSGASTSNISRAMGDGLLFKGFAAVVVGGFGDVRGTLAGGLLIGVAEVLGAQYISSSFRDAITFGILLAVLLIRPRGLFSELELKRA
jgi:branched-chain amino acid transport system permease protein